MFTNISSPVSYGSLEQDHERVGFQSGTSTQVKSSRDTNLLKAVGITVAVMVTSFYFVSSLSKMKLTDSFHGAVSTPQFDLLESGSFSDDFSTSSNDWSMYGQAQVSDSRLLLTSKGSSTLFGYAVLEKNLPSLQNTRVTIEFDVRSECVSYSSINGKMKYRCSRGITLALAPTTKISDGGSSAAATLDTYCSNGFICVNLDISDDKLECSVDQQSIYMIQEKLEKDVIKAIYSGDTNKIIVTMDYLQGGLTASFIPEEGENPMNIRMKTSSINNLQGSLYQIGLYANTLFSSSYKTENDINDFKMSYEVSGNNWNYESKMNQKDSMWQYTNDAEYDDGVLFLTNDKKKKQFSTAAMTKGIRNLDTTEISISFQYKVKCEKKKKCDYGIAIAIGPWYQLIETKQNAEKKCPKDFFCIQQSEESNYFRIAINNNKKVYNGQGTYNSNNVKDGQIMNVNIIFDMLSNGIKAENIDESGNIKTVHAPKSEIQSYIDPSEVYGVVFHARSGKKPAAHEIDNVVINVISKAPTASPTPLPSVEPTVQTFVPTGVPTSAPSGESTNQPSGRPSSIN
eukprot:CAMPEP_0182423120 /NCGR_PEP_ID=MMETSP1167-20130531/9038_1 /TAXON_ID=2988 /ORGANISM="Mallomonas Sp, Strain CCMP3275" /LENGTH=569 /DNA_ID=CAMNT_0024601809 /DNA_START=29 /DNA_END=1738 /DNA_ORIENTATION=-